MKRAIIFVAALFAVHANSAPSIKSKRDIGKGIGHGGFDSGHGGSHLLLGGGGFGGGHFSGFGEHYGSEIAVAPVPHHVAVPIIKKVAVPVIHKVAVPITKVVHVPVKVPVFVGGGHEGAFGHGGGFGGGYGGGYGGHGGWW